MLRFKVIKDLFLSQHYYPYRMLRSTSCVFPPLCQVRRVYFRNITTPLEILSVHLIFGRLRFLEPRILIFITAFPMQSRGLLLLSLLTWSQLIRNVVNATNVFVADFIEPHYSANLSKHLHLSHLDSMNMSPCHSPGFTPISELRSNDVLVNEPLQFHGHQSVTGHSH